VMVLRDGAELVIDKMCLCEHVDGYGDFKPLPQGHTFQAKTDQQLGELVQVYVELRNLRSELKGDRYVTAFRSSVSIPNPLDPTAPPPYFHNYGMTVEPLGNKTPNFDCARVYTFSLPKMSPGRYTLTIEIADETHQPPRVARKSCEIVVAPPAGH